MSTDYLLAAIGWTLLNFVWQGTLIGCAAAAPLALLRNARPEQRYAVACAALLLCLLWPAHDLARLLRAGTTDSVSLMVAMPAALRATASSHAGLLAWLQAHLSWIVGVWAGCAGLLALRMAFGLAWIGRMMGTHETQAMWQARLSQMAERFGLGRPVRLRVIAGLASPVTAGWWRPVVLVPASLVSGMPPELLEALLAHELAHIKRHDYLVNLAQNVVETLLFYHPATWWLSRRIRAERELIADALAARQLAEPRVLARALSELERRQFSAGRLAQAATGGDLALRVRCLVRPEPRTLHWQAALPILALALICMTKGLWPGAGAVPETTALTRRALIDFMELSASWVERTQGLSPTAARKLLTLGDKIFRLVG